MPRDSSIPGSGAAIRKWSVSIRDLPAQVPILTPVGVPQFHLLLEGSVQAFENGPDDRKAPLAVFGPGQVFGREHDGRPGSVSYITLAPSRFLVLPHEDFSSESTDAVMVQLVRHLLLESQYHARELSELQQQKAAISEILRSISRSPTDLQNLLQAVVEHAARLCDATDAGIMQVDGGELQLVAKFGPTPIWPIGSRVPISRGLVTGRSVIDRAPVHVPDLQALADEFPEGADTARRFGARTTFATPLMRGEQAIGTIFVRHFEIKPLTIRQIELVVAFADQAAIAIENVRLFHETRQKSRQVEEQSKELSEWNLALETRVAEQVAQIEELGKIEHELALAGQIQQRMLPRSVPHRDGYEFGACMVPAKSVGGDFYDFIPLGDEAVGIAIGDVSGKGIPAALFMAMVRSLLRAEAHVGRPPDRVLRSVNRHFMDMNDEMFVTMLFGVLDLARGEFHYVRAGHEPPIFFNGRGAVHQVAKSTGQPLGVTDDFALDEQKVSLSKGAMLLLYSDGLSDALNPRNERLGYGGIVCQVGRLARSPAQVVCDDLVRAASEHQAGTLQQDDITVVVLRAV